MRIEYRRVRENACVANYSLNLSKAGEPRHAPAHHTAVRSLCDAGPGGPKQGRQGLSMSLRGTEVQ